MAKGVALGLIDNGRAVRCAVSSSLAGAWLNYAPELADALDPVKVALDASNRWQTMLRRVVPRTALLQRAVGVLRSLRSRSTRAALASEVVWLPFHRVPLASERGIVTVHDLRVFEPELASAMDQRIIEQNVRKAQAVVCSWAHPYLSLIERFPHAIEKTFLIQLPVLNSGEPVERQAPTGRIRVLLPGFVTPHKNHQVVIRALALLPEIVVVFTGSEDGSHGDQLRALAHDLRVADRIEWRGFVSEAELEVEYARADLLVMPTRWEAASGPVYEAIVRGLPFVASDIPPIRSQLETLGLKAETFAWNSPEACAAAIRGTIAGYDLQVERLRRVAGPLRDRTWSQTASDYARVFDWVAAGAARPDDLTIGRMP